MATIVTTGWNATHLAVHREDLIGQSGQSELSLLRHPSYPFLAEISDDPSQLFDELRYVAEDYVDRVTRVAPRDPLIKALRFLKQGKPKQGKPKGFGWLPITWDGPDGLVDPRGSFVVRRSRGGTGFDRTIVLMAGNCELRRERRREPKRDEILAVDGLAVGLRVVMHADPATNGRPVPIRVTGLSMSELRRALDPKEARRIHWFSRFVDIFVQRVEQSLGFNSGTVHLNGFEQLGRNLVRVAGVGARSGACGGASQGFLWDIDVRRVDKAGKPFSIVSVREQEQRTFSALAVSSRRPGLFYRDPASCRGADDIRLRSPTGDEEVLNYYRKDAPFLPQRLEDDGRFQVLQSPVADLQNSAQDVQSIDRLKLPLRSDHLSAAQAFHRAREFLAKLSDFDLPEKAYFKFARLPLLMRHRACFDAHPDGKAVMAQVRLPDPPMALFGKYYGDKRPRLEVAFGAAELRHRDARKDDHGRESAQPLGLAADPRWAWHEFGHVLSYAATGALEYEFAHSVGDALAAVLNDATSHLRDEGLYAGETYPWVPAGRRHDREAAAGWCWCGRRNGQRHAAVTFPPRLYKGYVEEQMLSSSVFSFYRAIGGHPDNDEAMRKRAADAAAYLLMRAALLLGPGALVPARSADALVSAMVDADIGTRRPRNLFLGGCLHKVVRWAFERQGLFATASPEKNVEGPGLPPAVDLWVMDRRPNAEQGGYEPVTLEWPSAKIEEPDWFADPCQGVCGDASGNIHVIVRNRGACDATNVAVRAWAARARSGSLHWRYVGDFCVATVPGGGCVPVCIPAGLSGAKHYLLVEVSSSEDASNLDAETRLPCASGTPPDEPEALRDLVANDNNLALRLIP